MRFLIISTRTYTHTPSMSCTQTCTHIYNVMSLMCWKSSGCDSRWEKWIQVGVLQVLYPVAGSCHLVEKGGLMHRQICMLPPLTVEYQPSTVVISMHLSPAEIIHRLSLYDSGEIWDTTLLTSTTCNTNNDEHKSCCFTNNTLHTCYLVPLQENPKQGLTAGGLPLSVVAF